MSFLLVTRRDLMTADPSITFKIFCENPPGQKFFKAFQSGSLVIFFKRLVFTLKLDGLWRGTTILRFFEIKQWKHHIFETSGSWEPQMTSSTQIWEIGKQTNYDWPQISLWAFFSILGGFWGVCEVGNFIFWNFDSFMLVYSVFWFLILWSQKRSLGDYI